MIADMCACMHTYVHMYVRMYNSLEGCHDLGLGVLLLNELCLLNAAFTVTRQGQAGHAWFIEYRHTQVTAMHVSVYVYTQIS